ncbi:MAG: DUF5021 domain-containing protein [Ruminiclostridium sp.]|nr:DUF5021 domain-containing protein [Ruminiclostridium sp.]
MIKKLQQLKAKKGFTLVELIVVIAIIGVLAAILVPTMMGFVTSSRVTSANSTAASIQDQIEQFLTDCDTKNYGMLQGTTSTAIFNITVTNGSWTTTLAAGAPTAGAAGAAATGGSFKNVTGGPSWATAGTAMAPGSPAAAQANVPLNLLSIKLMNLFPDLKQAAIVAYAKAGHVEAVVYSADTDVVANLGTIATATYNATSGKLVSVACDANNKGGVDWEKKISGWDGSTAGISPEGFTIGTAPALALGAPAAPTT